MYSKGFNNCYILLSNISQAFENTKFGAGELSLIVSLLEEKADQIQRLTDENQQWQELAQKLNSENRLLQKQNSELLTLNSR